MQTSEYYNIFNKEGKLKQVEYSMEAVHAGNPCVVLRTESCIYASAKKIVREQLECERRDFIRKSSQNVYSIVTGYQPDVDQVINMISDRASSLEYNLGYAVTPDILTTEYANTMQVLVQRTGRRVNAFAAALVGYDGEKPMLYYTDASTVVYSYFGIAMGEHHGKMMKVLEKEYRPNMNDEESAMCVIESLMASIGTEINPNEIEVARITKHGVEYLNDSEIDGILLKITEKE